MNLLMKNTLPLKGIPLFLLITLVVACGGGGASIPAPKTGKISISINWPTPSRIIPTASKSIKVVIKNSLGVTIDTAVLNKPASSWLSSNLAIDNYTLTTTAHPETNGSGITQAIGIDELQTQENQTVSASINMASTVTTVSIIDTATSTEAQSTIQCKASCKNSNGDTVLVHPSTISWTSDKQNIASVNQEGLVLGISPGTTSITATFNEIEASLNQKPVSSSLFLISVTEKRFKLYKTLTGHLSEVRALAYSPAGDMLASGSMDNSIKLWQTSTSESSATLQGHTGWVYGLGFSNDSLTLASCSWDKTLILWDIGSKSLKSVLGGHNDAVWSLDYSPDNSTIVSCSSDDSIYIWNAQTGSKQKELIATGDWVRTVKYLPDGESIVSSGWVSYARLWDASNGSVKLTFQNTGGAASMDISHDGKTLAIGSYDHSVKIYDTATGALISSLLGHSNVVTSVKFSPDAKTIVSGSSDNTLKIWNTSTGLLVDTLDGHTGAIWSIKFSPDAKTIASGSADKTIKLWRTL
jgi:WD40 repeat protein